MTGSSLFAPDAGDARCYYCGAPCSGEYLTADYVKDTFTNRDIVAFPGSTHVCRGCVESMGAGPDQMEMIDGTMRQRQNARGMQPRMYSWILTLSRKLAATKAHIAQLRDIVLAPPNEFPFAIILSDSGQKQLIFRAPLAFSRDNYPLLLEDEVIQVDVEQLKNLISLAGRVCAASGKPALLGEIGIGTITAYYERFGDTDGIERWLEVRDRPLSRLAAWLCPSKEVAQNEYPAIERNGVPAEIGGACGPEPAAAGGGPSGSEGLGGQIHFDFGGAVW